MSMSRRQWMMVAAAGGASMALTACGGSDGPAVETRDVVQIAQADPQFSILVEAVVAADLVNTLKGPGPFTVFAPTDEAFAKLPKGTVEDLLKPENKAKLTAILTYHVVPGAVKSAQAMTLSSAKTVNGKALTLKVDGGALHVDSAKVVTADIEASNGVIHVIDTVVIPQ